MTFLRSVREFSTTAQQVAKSSPLREELKLTGKQKLGFGILLGGYSLSKSISEERQEVIASKWSSVLQTITGASEFDTRKVTYDCIKSWACLMKASPAFYMLFPLIHKSGLVWHKHLLLAATKGVTGTLNSAPVFAGLYLLAPPVLLAIQHQCEKRGVSRENAILYAQASTFLGLAAGFDWAGELDGYKVPLSKIGPKLFVFGSVAVTCRMFFGLMSQHQVGSSAEELTQEQKIENFFRSAVGTTLPQWFINSIAMAVKEDRGMTGVRNYLRTANTSGLGSAADSGRQLGFTFLQRLVFCYVWNEFSSEKGGAPEWSWPAMSAVEVALRKVKEDKPLRPEETALLSSLLQRALTDESSLTAEERAAVSTFIQPAIDSGLEIPSSSRVVDSE